MHHTHRHFQILGPLLMLWGLCFLLISRANAASEKWEEYMKKQLAEISEPPSPENLSLLTTVAATKPDEDLRRGRVQEEAWIRLSSYPNFDELLLEAIRQKRKQWKDGGYAGDYDRFRVGVIQGLEKIVDPRAIRVLGELLGDMENTMPNDFPNTPPSGYFAGEVLYRMLESPPVKSEHPDLDTDMPTWQLWYEQVKAGNRSFRFKGDPREYNLKEPVSQSAAAPRTMPAAPGKTPEEAAQNVGSLHRWPLVLACGALGAGLVVVFRARRKRVD